MTDPFGKAQLPANADEVRPEEHPHATSEARAPDAATSEPQVPDHARHSGREDVWGARRGGAGAAAQKQRLTVEEQQALEEQRRLEEERALMEADSLMHALAPPRVLNHSNARPNDAGPAKADAGSGGKPTVLLSEASLAHHVAEEHRAPSKKSSSMMDSFLRKLLTGWHACCARECGF
jgi:hypothetical protein